MKTLPTLTALMLATTPLFAEPQRFESSEAAVSLVELFTSEGCSSCPPADKWVSRLKDSPELWKSVVPVVFHVDYWNGLGWPDRFASRTNSDRQRGYAAAWRSDSVYTPGFVLNGQEWRDWSRSEGFPKPGVGNVGRLQATLRDRNHADIVFTPTASGLKPSRVELALLGSNLESDVKRGENSGRRLRHDFVVLYHTTAELKPDGNSYIASIPLPEKMSVTPSALAAWVTNGDAQPPIQATGGWLKN